jgi:hypothetical protein
MERKVGTAPLPALLYTDYARVKLSDIRSLITEVIAGEGICCIGRLYFLL